jgi:hypothetical protein
MTSPTPSPISDQAAGFDMLAHLARQRAWSEMTFGPGARTKGVVDHIRKELLEIEGDPTDLTEWIDVVILALDGAWRAGGSPEQIIATMVAKQTKNEGRAWPDWRTADPDKAIEHDRSEDTAPTTVCAFAEEPCFVECSGKVYGRCPSTAPTTGSAPDMFDQGSPATQAVNTRILNLASPAVFGPGELENALVELVNKIDTSLDSGDLLIDARRASAALDSIFAKGDLVANAHDYFRDSPSRYENSVEFSIGWNACLDAIGNARAALLAASMGGDRT